MPIANQEMIRDNNRRLVLEYIVNNPPVSRADLSKQLSHEKYEIDNYHVYFLPSSFSSFP